MRTRIMYIGCKAGALTGPARIGRVGLSKTRRTVYYAGRTLHRLPGGGFKANHDDPATGEEYWVPGPKRAGGDRLYGGRVPVHVDEDVRAGYWTRIRGQPERAHDRDAGR